MFPSVYVNRLRAALDRQLRIPHELVCITDDPAGLDGDVRVLELPTELRETPRCRRRMRQFDREFAHAIGERILAIDLDIVLVGDITPIVQRDEPLVCWKVQHAGVFSGSFLLMDAGVLDVLWQRFAADPQGYPTSIEPRGVPSDQAMLNAFLKGTTAPHWTERDGFVTFYGRGYERFEHLGVGLHRSALPRGARVVVLGSADTYVLEDGRFDWAREHWGPPLTAEARA